MSLEINRPIQPGQGSLMGECPKLLFWWERRLASPELLLGNSSDTSAGAVVHVWCQPNYVLRGQQVVRCEHGAWEPATPWCGDREVYELNIPWIIIIICCIVIFFIFLCSFYWCCKSRKKNKAKAEEFKYYQEQRSKVYYPAIPLPPGEIIYHESREPSLGRDISEKESYEYRERPRRAPLDAYPGVYHREVHREVIHEPEPPVHREVHRTVIHDREPEPEVHREVHRRVIHEREPQPDVHREVIHHRYRAPGRVTQYEYEEEGGEDNLAYERGVRRTVEYDDDEYRRGVRRTVEVEDQAGPSYAVGVRRTVQEGDDAYGRGVRRTVEEDEQAYGRGVRRTIEQESVATGRTRRIRDWFAQYRRWYSAFSGRLGAAATRVFRRGAVPTAREIHVTEYEDREPQAVFDAGARAYGGVQRTTYEEDGQGYGVGVRRTTVEEGGATAYGVHRATYDTGLQGQRREVVTTTTTVQEGPTYYESNNPNTNDPDEPQRGDKVYTWKGGKIDVIEDDTRTDAPSIGFDA